MQSHASRHVASEFLKDRHPDLSPPFPKVRLDCNTVLHGSAPKIMSSPYHEYWHASHQPLWQDVIKDEIAIAFGRRGVQKVRHDDVRQTTMHVCMTAC